MFLGKVVFLGKVPPGREIKKQFLNFGNQNRPNKLRNAVLIYKKHYSSAAATILGDMQWRRRGGEGGGGEGGGRGP